MATRKSEAEALRMAYGAGLVKRSEVIAWACQVVQDEDLAIMFRLDDALELAASGVHGEVPCVTAEIDAFLSRYMHRP
jgi:hypothetical protein